MRARQVIYAFIILTLIVSCGNRQPKLGTVTEATVAMLDTTKHTTMGWKDTVVQFGTVKEGDSVRMEFGFTNTGQQLLFITEVKPSCGCTIADYPKEPVKPGGSGVIKAVFATEWHPGLHRKMIFVRANTKPHTGHKLIFTGEVVAKPKQTKS